MLWGSIPPAFAIGAFSDQFRAKYVKEKPTNEKEKAFAEAVTKAKCLVCHQGRSKKDRNPYGAQLAELLDRRTDRDKIEKIQKAMNKVAKMKSDPKKKDSPTFGELIADGKLPGGDPEKAKSEEKRSSRP
jgi:cytochrome c2